MNRFHQKQLRVLQVGPDRNSRGGIASLLHAMGESATLFENQGVTLRFISTTQPGNNSELGKVKAFLHALWCISKAVIKSEVDVVHIHAALKGSLVRKILLAWICRLSRMPYILQIHNGGFFNRYSEMTGLSRFFVARTLRHAGRVIVLSSHMQKLAVSIGAIPEDRCALVYNGIADPLQGGAPKKEKHTGVVQIVFLGLISAAKGIPTLLDAIEALAWNSTKFAVTVYGNGDVENFQVELTKRGLSDCVVYGGWIGGEEKEAAFATSDIFVLPSKSEGFSVAVLEAMAHGLTIISTSIPGVLDAVRNDIEALLVPTDDAMALADAIRVLVDDRGLRLRLGSAARRRYLQCFSMGKMASELSFIYSVSVR